MSRAGRIALGLALAGLVAACNRGATSSPVERAPLPIPPVTSAPSTTAPTITTPGGAPEVVQFESPTSFYCLAEYPDEAQVTIGWSVPSATAVTVLVDGIEPATGIQPSMPYQVPAGPPSGIGATIVFPCEPLDQHTVTIRWQMGSSPAAERVVTITKGA